MPAFDASTSTTASRLTHWSETDPTSTAFVFRSTHPKNQRLVLTRWDVFNLASRFAAILQRKGIRRGQVVCNTLPNSPERLLTDMGITLAGATTLNGQVFLADGADFVGTLQQVHCVAIITDPSQPANALKVLKGRYTPSDDNGFLTCPEVPSLQHMMEIDCRANEDGLKPLLEELKQEKGQYIADVQPTDLAYIMTTSGTTGFSKLVPRSHASLMTVGQVLKITANHKDGDIMFNDRSLGWIGGAPILYLCFGIHRVLTDLSTPSPDPLALMWSSVWEEGVTLALFVPVHIDMSLARPELWQNKGSLRCIISGGQPIKKQHLGVLGTIARSVCIVYGSTESGVFNTRVITSQEEADTFHDCDVGFPAEGTEVKLLDDNQQEIQAVDQVGEVVVRGPTVFQHYIGVYKTEDVFTQDGFFRTSDVGFWSKEGNLHVICRKSNAIMHGSFIVYPGWLESRIEKCPGIQNAIVVPVPDPSLHQELCACLLPSKGSEVTEEEVHQFCSSLFVVPEKSEMSAVPKLYLFFDSFPATPTGKTDRRAIRDLALKRLGITDSPFPAVFNGKVA